MKTKFIFSICFLVLITNSFAINTYSVEQIKASYKNGDTDKFRLDNLPLLDSKALIEKGIFNSKEEMKPIEMSKEVCQDKLISLNDSKPLEIFKCKTNIPGTNLTSSLYDINLQSGKYKCAVAENKYKPFGYYEMSIPDGCKQFLKKDKIKARKDNKDIIKISEDLYANLYSQKKAIKDSVSSYDGENFLNITDILLSAILSDTDIINMQGTKASNRIQLQNGFNSQITDPDSEDISSLDHATINTTSNNSDFISAKASTIADVYAKLSDLSMVYLFMLVIFFGLWGTGGRILIPLVSKIEDKQDHDKKIPYIAALLVGATLFFPVGREDIQTNNNGDTEEYSVMKSNYQNFERYGYYLFMNWATDAAEVIVDSEMDGLISSAGLSNTKDIIYNYSSKVQSANFFNVNRNITQLCNGVYSVSLIKQLTSDKTTIYPTSELSFYAENINNGNGARYYNPISNGGIVRKFSHSDNQGEKYPDILLSACGKANSKLTIYEKQYNDYDSALEKATIELNNPDDGKILIVKNLIEFQYELLRDYGALGILGLPVTIMQTEQIGSLSSKDNDIKDAIKENGEYDTTLHGLLSSIAYLYLPGAGTVFQVASESAGSIGTAAGSAIGSFIGAAIGFVVGKIGGTAFALWLSHEVGSTLLALTPIIGIVLIGLLRFLIILMKIFTYHFASIFILPILFSKDNIQAVSAFSMKVLANMLELPVFVLSIWLAMTANTLLHIIGESLAKKIILGMLQNNEISNSGSWLSILKIYLFDGVMEVSIGVFSIIIIYKIIVTMHTAIFEVLEVKGGQALDNTIESMKNEGAGQGAKI